MGFLVKVLVPHRRHRNHSRNFCAQVHIIILCDHGIITNIIYLPSRQSKTAGKKYRKFMFYQKNMCLNAHISTKISFLMIYFKSVYVISN